MTTRKIDGMTRPSDTIDDEFFDEIFPPVIEDILHHRLHTEDHTFSTLIELCDQCLEISRKRKIDLEEAHRKSRAVSSFHRLQVEHMTRQIEELRQHILRLTSTRGTSS